MATRALYPSITKYISLRSLPLLSAFFRKPTETIYTSPKGYEIVVEDPRRLFTYLTHYRLAQFLDDELLHSDKDINSLLYIKIDEFDNQDWGSWIWGYDETSGRSGGVIILNYTWLKTESKLKEILAHEYGHHWTITYCMEHHWPSKIESGGATGRQRLPEEFYKLRGLNTANYYPDTSRGKLFCDREIIAEDYKVLFAPHPHNQVHDIIEEMVEYRVRDILEMPGEPVKRYIKNLQLPPLNK